MAEDLGEKTEEATPKRLRDAREEGKVARSVDLTSALVLAGGHDGPVEGECLLGDHVGGVAVVPRGVLNELSCRGGKRARGGW